MNAYEEYPKVLRHPGEAPAVVSLWDEKLQRHVPEHGSPAKFQPVTVHNSDQEQEYLAKGYRAAVNPDANFFNSARASAAPSGYIFQEYPKMIGDTVVGSREEEEALAGKDAPRRKTYAERTKAA